jgi:hypothetical protein
MPRYLYTPSDYSPTYDVESDGNGSFVKLHAVWNIPPDYPDALQIMEQLHVEYITSESNWQTYLEHQRSLGRTP